MAAGEDWPRRDSGLLDVSMTFPALPLPNVTARFVLPFISVILAACGGDSTAPEGGPPAGALAHIAQVSSAVGSTAAGFETADSIAIKVTDSADKPIAGQAVT